MLQSFKKMNRLNFTASIVLGILGIAGSASGMASETALKRAPDRSPLVGAIQWYAWTGGCFTEETLGPEKYHDRLPWFAEVIDSETVSFERGGTQEVIDQEIRWASVAGIDYWAFFFQSDENPMDTAMDLYQSSAFKYRLKFSLILHNTMLGTDAAWPAERQRIIEKLGDPQYQKVMGDRPLVYMFRTIQKERLMERFRDLKSHIAEAGYDPYYVLLLPDPVEFYAEAIEKGFDAVSSYAVAINHKTPFSELVDKLKKEHWEKAVDAGISYVPLVTTGWDKNPRKDNPVRPQWQGAGFLKARGFPERATAQELTEHFREALKFTRKHPDLCPAQAVLVYAWNEYDEGGWLAPTRSKNGEPDLSRLRAVRKALKNR